MKKIILSALAIMVAVAMFIPCATDVLAASSIQMSINAPNKVETKTTVNIQVVDNGGDTIYKAGVYLLDDNDLKVINNYIIGKTGNIDYAAFAEDRGALIDKTDTQGKVIYKFTEEGKYLLVALKDGYVPAIHWITVDNTNNIDTFIQRQVMNAGVQQGNGYVNNAAFANSMERLIIDADNNVDVNTTVTIMVTDQDDDEVYRAAVYLLENEDLRFNNGNSGQYDLEAVAEDEGKLIGNTNTQGKVTYRFTEEGAYLLVALKGDYIPAMQEITVGDISRTDNNQQGQFANAGFQQNNDQGMNNNNAGNNGQVGMQNNNSAPVQNQAAPGTQNNQQQMNNNNNDKGPGFMANMGNFFKGFFEKANKWFPWNRG